MLSLRSMHAFKRTAAVIVLSLFFLFDVAYPIRERLHLCRTHLEGLARNGRNARPCVQSQQVVGQNRHPKSLCLAD
jgi:hypothetical protein